MTGPRVVNRKNGSHPGAVYIGRGSVWGNPYKIGRDGTRAEVIEKYSRYVMPHLDVTELRGKDLECWCAPLPCHGDLLLEAANRD